MYAYVHTQTNIPKSNMDKRESNSELARTHTSYNLYAIQ
jgi:hypothetical protein